jgi:hypothetical protein
MKCRSADEGRQHDAGMRAISAVRVRPGAKLLAALVFVLISACMSPFSGCDLDEAFGLAAGERSIGPSEAMCLATPSERLKRNFPPALPCDSTL